MNEHQRTQAANGSTYVLLTDDPETGGWTRLLIRPAGRIGGVDHPTDFEYHTPQEEIFFLEGSCDFGGHYFLDSPGYLNHPPYWVHPGNLRFAKDRETVMLVRLSKPIDTTYLPIPENWDKREFFAEEVDFPRGKAISALQLDEVEYGPILLYGAETGEEAGVLWHNPKDDVVTWLWRIPPGWKGSGDPVTVAGSDEVYVISGDLTTLHDGKEVTFGPGSYYCNSDTFSYGGSKASSKNGLWAVRWSKQVPEVQLPPVGHSRTVDY